MIASRGRMLGFIAAAAMGVASPETLERVAAKQKQKPDDLPPAPPPERRELSPDDNARIRAAQAKRERRALKRAAIENRTSHAQPSGGTDAK